MLRAKQINLTFTQNPVLKNVSVDLLPGRITLLLGKSGAGKTTLLRCLAGLENNFSGQITLDDQDTKQLTLKQRATRIGFVFQQLNLFPHMTVLQNCALPLQKVLLLSREQAEQKALAVLASLGMESFAQSYPAQLSGGQQQRVALARALGLGPKVLLLDEPTSALDPENSLILAQILKRLCKQGIAVVISCQDMTFAKMVLDRAYLLEGGQVVECMESVVDLPEKSSLMRFLTLKIPEGFHMSEPSERIAQCKQPCCAALG